jgi:hypothetical protein
MLAGHHRAPSARRPSRHRTATVHRVATARMAHGMTTSRRIAILTGAATSRASTRHQERRLPRHASRLRRLGIRAAGRADPRPAGAARRGADYLRPLDRINTGPSTGPAAPSCTPRGPTRARCGRARCRLDAGATGRATRSPRRHDLTPLVLDHLSALGVDVLVSIGGDDTLSYSQVLADAGVALMASPRRWTTTSRGPSTASASRRPSRGPRSHQPAADDARLARADRRVPDLRPRRRVLRPVHGVRDLGALRHPEAPTTSMPWPTS